MGFKNFLKETKDFLIRLFLFCLAVKCLFFYIGGILAYVLFPIWVLLAFLFLDIIKTVAQNFQCYAYEDEYLGLAHFAIDIIAPCTIYLFAKIFGIFKKLDKVNFFISFIIICSISYLLIYVGKFNFLMDEEIYKYGLKYSYTMYFLIPAFLLYK